jgi:adenylate cyclase
MSMDEYAPVTGAGLSEVGNFRVGGCSIEPAALRVVRDGRSVRLEPRAMQLLVYLAEHAGEVISRAQLEQQVWEGRVVGEDALTNSIAKLRRAMADNARHPRVIETLPKTGYRLIAEVAWAEGAADRAAAAFPSRQWPFAKRRLALALLLTLLVSVTTWWVQSRQPGNEPAQLDATDGLAGKPSVAVLPFENHGEGSQQDYFANGITTNLITDLSRVSALRVIAAGSVFSYSNIPSGSARTISRELDVDYVVIGSVQRQGEIVRVNTQLIEAANERAIWAERYESGLNDMFNLQDRVALALVNALNVELSSSEFDSFGSQQRTGGEAYDLFLHGMEEYGHRTLESTASAQHHFEQAIALDPGFARAIAALALVHLRYAIDGWTTTPQLSLQKAADFADQAAEINQTIPQIHFAAGQLALFRGRHEEAVAAVQRAIHFSPSYADAYALLAWIHNYAGRTHEALASLEKARFLNPIVPASYTEILGEIHFQRGEYVEAVSAFERALQVNPAHMRARMWLVATLVQSGDIDEAAWQAEMLQLSFPGFSLLRLGYAFPFHDPRVRERVLHALRRAGLPE